MKPLMFMFMLKAFVIYLVITFFVGAFRTWRALRELKKNLRSKATGPKKMGPKDGVVEAQYRVLDTEK